MTALSENVNSLLKDNENAHGFLVRRHGLYSWGDNLAQAKRHVEILEFLLEAIGRTRLMPQSNTRGV
jgi:methylthioribulose-1-phosphate dehydratase